MSPQSWPLLAPPATGSARTPREVTFSVVIAAYQAEHTIMQAVESALGQTVPPLEVVVCDDGSTDGTADVVARMGSGVRLVRQLNTGESGAKNAAVRAARGDYAVVLDADDAFLPHRLEALSWAARVRPDLDVLVTDAYLELAGVRVGRAYHDDWPFPVDEQRTVILSRNFVLGQAAVRRDRWVASGGFDEGLHHASDWDFFLRLVLGGASVGLVDVPLAVYRLAAGSLSSDRDRLIAARVEVLRRALARDDISPGERAVAARALRDQRGLLATQRARTALAGASRGGRAAALGGAVSTGVRPATRAALAAGAVAPRLIGRRWARPDGGVELAGGVRVTGGEPVPMPDDPSAAGDDRCCWVRGVAVSPSTRPLRGRLLAPPVVGACDPHVYAIVAADGDVTGSGPPDVVAARLRRAGTRLRWVAPVLQRDRASVLAAARDAGMRSVAALRAEPELLTRMRVGSWWQAPWSRRLLRSAGLPGPVSRLLPAAVGEDLAFWGGVRISTTRAEWQRLTRTYVTLAYHRLAGEARPGQERYDVAPARFARQLSMLRRLGWRPLAPEQIVDVHSGAAAAPRRAFVVTIDDGYADAVAAAVRHAAVRPHVYVPTQEVGTVPPWGAGAPLATWADLEAAARAGVVVGSHAQCHVPLPGHGDARLAQEVAGALADLEGRGLADPPFVAYPNGRYDERVRAAVESAGYAGAWTTLPGRNGAGTDPWSLRRVGVRDWDGPLSLLWKAMTGEPVPAVVEAVTARMWAARTRRLGGGPPR